MKELIEDFMFYRTKLTQEMKRKLQGCRTIRSGLLPMDIPDANTAIAEEKINTYLLTCWRSHYISILNNLNAFNTNETKNANSLASLHKLASIEIEVAKRKYLESFVFETDGKIIVKETLIKQRIHKSGISLCTNVDKINTTLGKYSGLLLSQDEVVRLQQCLQNETMVIISQPVTTDKAKFTVDTKRLDLYIEII